MNAPDDKSETFDSFVFDFDALFEPETYLYFQDSLTDEVTTQQVEFLIREISLKPGMDILDLACGHGRHANKLAKPGYNVTGIDINDGFLSMAKEDASRNGVSVEYLKDDMRSISYKDKFDAVILLVNEIGYFDDNTNIKVVGNIHSALKTGGHFCFDCVNRDIILKHFMPYIVIEKDGNFQLDKNSFDPITGRLICIRTYIMDGKVSKAPFSMRFYNYNEIRMLLESVGFDIKSVFGGWDSSEFTNESFRMIIVAQKR